MTGTYIGKTYKEYRREFVEHFQYGKQIGKILDIKNRQKRPQAQKPIFLDLESEKSENRIPHFEKFEKYMRKLGACMRKRLGACMRKLGASFMTAESLPDSR